jgi:uncharacterized protein YegL
MSLSVQTYNGFFGESVSGPIINIKTVSSLEDAAAVPEEIFLYLVIDTSASMEESLPQLKAALMTIGGLLEELRDFGNRVKLTLISFSGEAKEIWTNATEIKHTNSYQSEVSKLNMGSKTNLYAGLNLAFAKYGLYSPGKPAWVVVMTDGEANEGLHQASDDLISYVSAETTGLPIKMVSIGYGDNYDATVLSGIGSYVHVRDAEQMNDVFGSLIAEMQTAFTFDAELTLPEKPREESEMDLVVHPIETNRIVYGTTKIGTLFQDKEFALGFVPENVFALVGQTITLTYTLFDGTPIVKTALIPAASGIPPSSVLSSYYEHMHDLCVKRLYSAVQSGMNTSSVIADVREIINDWHLHSEGVEPRTKLRRLIETLGRTDSLELASQAMGTLTQGVGQTPMQTRLMSIGRDYYASVLM